MVRIGIIGTENSHAMAYTKLFNQPGENGAFRHPGYRVTGVFGPLAETAEKVVTEGGADYAAGDFTELLGKIDALMVTSRRGSVHHQYAAPFIDAGIPVFVDKPFTSDPAQAEDLIARAKKSGAPVWGGSGFKIVYDNILMKHAVKAMRAEGTFRGAAVNFCVMTESEYDGFYFYAPHLTETALTVFGMDMRAVHAFGKGKNVTVIARYDDCDVSLHYTDGTFGMTSVAYCTKGNVVRQVDSSLGYPQTVDIFARMIETRTPPECYDDLVRPVAVMDAILKSLETGKEIAI
jgi:predicted dehydrogenase